EELDGPVVVPPPDPDHDPAAIKDWATSNIYFKPEVQGTGNGDGTGAGDVGTLTFAESKADGTTFGRKEGYQCVYFKWGSLIGVSTNTSGTGYDNDNTFLFIPDLATGKYHKYKVGNVTSTPGDIIVNTYLDKATGNTWVNIPCADDSGLPTGRDKNSLSGIHNPDNYKGDICRYLSAKRSVNGSGLVNTWQMPVSDMFAGDDYMELPYTANGSVWKPHDDYSSGSFVEGIKENGTSQTANAFMTYMYSPTGETVYFPASGNRGTTGNLNSTGDYGDYWSSSAANGTNAHPLDFNSYYVDPAYSYYRAHGYSVRCVRDRENVVP
ncbi:MAG: hypothetical protein LBR26_05445, partial [Prevotella sp.]|nr:hypothetical protein [Prevotella sp.]